MPAPASALVPPRPQGDLDTAVPETVTGLVDANWPRKQPRSWLRRKGLTWLLGYLDGHPGRTWQEKWLASGLNDGDRKVRELTTGNLPLDGELGHSLMLLCCLRVIRPSLAAFRINSFVRYPTSILRPRRTTRTWISFSHWWTGRKPPGISSGAPASTWRRR